MQNAVQCVTVMETWLKPNVARTLQITKCFETSINTVILIIRNICKSPTANFITIKRRHNAMLQ